MKTIPAAIGRLETALKYGSDMKSSRALCVSDAKELLQQALKEKPTLMTAAILEGALAALSQKAHFSADIRFALTLLENVKT